MFCPQMTQTFADECRAAREGRWATRMSFMARDLETIVRDALELSESDRATLAGLLIESLKTSPDPEVEELGAVEAERRWQEIQSGAVQAIPLEEVRARLFRRG
jgi:putative addiction module component (TIGR02574 family)